ncbi:AAA family ATPase [Aeromonas caviae]
MQLQGIHKRYDLNISFHESLTVLHGQNGTGKTTLIHIIANIANCDFIRFAFLDFQKIHTWFSDGTEIILTQTGKDISKKYT